MSSSDYIPTPLDLTLEADARCDSLQRITSMLASRVDDSRQSPGVINFDKFEERARCITALRHLLTQLQNLTVLVARAGSAADSLHKAELKAIQEGLGRVTGAAEEPALPPPVVAPPAPKPAAGPWTVVQKREGRRLVKVVGELSISAAVVPADIRNGDVLAAVTEGDLFYIPQWNHFAVRIAGCVFHANVGQVYRGGPQAGRESIVRVKDCQPGKCAGQGKCGYYHNPATHLNSSDVRNYTADSWMYTPAAAPGRFGTRHIGSVDHLETDLNLVSAEDAQLFIDQTAHDILCAVILNKYVLSRKTPARPKKMKAPASAN